jgi:hypothetical protein
MTQPFPQDLTDWLDTATRGLPPTAASIAKNELLAHYQDAAADYGAAGRPESEAHRLALADLGQAEIAANGFKDAHLGHRRYLLATAAAMGNLLALLVFPMVYIGLNLGHRPQTGLAIFAAADFTLWGFTLIVFLVLGQLLRWRFGLTRLNGPIRLSLAGLTIQIAADVTSLLRYGYSHNISFEATPGLFDMPPGPETIIKLVSFAGFLLIGIGLLQAAPHIYKLGGILYGLGKPVAILLIILGVSFATAWLWLNIPNKLPALLVGLAVQVSHLLLWPLLTLLFFRAVYRPPSRPARLA